MEPRQAAEELEKMRAQIYFVPSKAARIIATARANPNLNGNTTIAKYMHTRAQHL